MREMMKEELVTNQMRICLRIEQLNDYTGPKRKEGNHAGGGKKSGKSRI
jgi:hypothetical protein